MRESTLMYAIALAILCLLGMPSHSHAQACTAADGITCDNEGAPCSPPTGGTCRQGLRCMCRGTTSATEAKCERTMAKNYAKFAALKMKLEGKCNDKVMTGGRCDPVATNAKINSAAGKANVKTQAACNGVDLTKLGGGSCANPDGVTNNLPAALNCLESSHREDSSTITDYQAGTSVSTLIRCCILSVCTKTNAANCTSAGGTNIGPGSCHPDPCP